MPHQLANAVGKAVSDNFGDALSGAGDVNGDGYADVIVGADGYGTGSGAVYVYLGTSEGLSTTPNLALYGPEAYSYFGSSVSGAGDVDGDGFADVILGSLGGYDGGGRAFVHAGSAGGVHETASTELGGGTEFGSTVSGAGDVNADGYDDVLVGERSDNKLDVGDVHLYTGSAGGVDTTAEATVTGEVVSDHFGSEVSGDGDFDRDGFDDVIVSTFDYTTYAPIAYVFVGTSGGIGTSPTQLYHDTGEYQDGTYVSGGMNPLATSSELPPRGRPSRWTCA